MGIKVLHLIDSGGLYGAERMLLSLVKEQLKQGLEPMILSAGDVDAGEKPLEAEARINALPIIPWRMKAGLNLKESWRILQWSKENNYDLLHSHGFKFNVLIGIYPALLRRIPLIATLHGYIKPSRFSRLWFYERLDRIAIRRMRGVVIVSASMSNEMPRKLRVRDRVWTICNGLDIPEIERLSRHPLKEPFHSFLSRHNPVVLGVGRLSKEKGFDQLIVAFSELKKAYPNSGLLIVGEGKLRKHLELTCIQMGVEDSVYMPGFCDTVPSLLTRADVLVIPSLTEGLPITLLESMALGIPIAATDVGEISKVLGFGSGGQVLKDNNVKTIFIALEAILTNAKASEQRAIWARKEVVRNYSSESMALQYLKFYRQVVGI